MSPVIGTELGVEFDQGVIQSGKIRLKLGPTLSLGLDGTINCIQSNDQYQTGVTTLTVDYIYTSFLSIDGFTYKVCRADRVTQVIDYATGTAPVPADLTTLTYV